MKKTRFYQLLMLTCVQIVMLSSCQKLNLEHKEARNVVIENIDFSLLKLGEYEGYYAGGIYGWRENTCRVTVDSFTQDQSRVSTIELVNSESDYTQAFLDSLYGIVIRKQSLQIDAVSGATLDTKACLKAIENALLQAK